MTSPVFCHKKVALDHRKTCCLLWTERGSTHKIESIIRYTCSEIWWSWSLVQNILLLCQWTSDFWKYPVSILSNLFCFQFGCDGPSSLSSISVGRYKFHWSKVNIQNKFSNRSPYWLCHTRGSYAGALPQAYFISVLTRPWLPHSNTRIGGYFFIIYSKLLAKEIQNSKFNQMFLTDKIIEVSACNWNVRQKMLADLCCVNC